MNDQTDLLTIEADKWADPLTAPMDLVAPVEALPAVAEPTAEQPPAVISEGPGALLGAIVQLAKDRAVDVTKLQALLGMQERMEERQAARLFDEALGRAQAAMPRVPKNGIVDLGGGQRKVRLGKWEDLDTVVAPIAAAEGFSYTFSEERCDANGIRWEATFRAFGHREKNGITLPADTSGGKNAVQARGSTNRVRETVSRR